MVNSQFQSSWNTGKLARGSKVPGRVKSLLVRVRRSSDRDGVVESTHGRGVANTPVSY